MGLKESGLRASVRSVSTVLPAFFDVVITDTNSPVNEGDVLEVDYDVDNTGDAFDTQDIRLEIDDVQEDVDPDVSLSGGDGTSGTLFWDTTGQEADTYSATVLSDDDSDTVTVEIPDAFFDVAITGTNSPVTQGEVLDVDYFVENTGGVDDTQDIRLEIDNVEEDRDSDITLNASNSTSGTLNWDTDGEDADTYTATVLSDDDTDSVTVEVEFTIPDSVINHWPIDEEDDNTISDAAGSIDLDPIGPTLTSDSSSADEYHFELDGIDDRIRLDDSSDESHFYDLDQLTAIVWARFDSAVDLGNFVGHFDNGGSTSTSNTTWGMRMNDDNTITAILGGAGTGSRAPVSFSTGGWNMWTYRIDGGSTVEIIKNDFEDSNSESVSDHITSEGDNFVIGGAPDGSRRCIEGAIDFSAFSHTFMSDSDISEYYNGHPRS